MNLLRKIIICAVVLAGNLQAGVSNCEPTVDPKTLHVVDVKYIDTKPAAPMPQPERNNKTIADFIECLHNISKTPHPSPFNINTFVQQHCPESERYSQQLGYVGEETNRIIMNLLLKEMGADVVRYHTHNSSNNGHDECYAIHVNGEWALLLMEAKIKGEQSLEKIYKETYSATKIERRNLIAEKAFQKSFKEFMAQEKKQILKIVYALDARNGKSSYLVEALDRKIHTLQLRMDELEKLRAENADSKEVKQKAGDVVGKAAELLSPARGNVVGKTVTATKRQIERAAAALDYKTPEKKLGKRRRKNAGDEDTPNTKRAKLDDITNKLAELSPESQGAVLARVRKITRPARPGQTTKQQLDFSDVILEGIDDA